MFTVKLQNGRTFYKILIIPDFADLHNIKMVILINTTMTNSENILYHQTI